MDSKMETGMQEILLDDADEDCVEFRLLMAFAQRKLSDSKFQELIKNRHTQVQDEKNGKIVEPLNGHGGKAPRAIRPAMILTGKKKKKAGWKRMIPRCIRGEKLESDSIQKGEQLGRKKERGTVESETSVESAFKQEDEALIQRIVAILIQSGDRLQEVINSDKTLHKGICELFTSYSYFKKVTDLYVGDQVIEEEVEIQQQSVKIAFAMDITTKLTAIDHHPMNKVLGFGVKYLKEKFSPWIKKHGGWEKAFSVMDLEDVD